MSADRLRYPLVRARRGLFVALVALTTAAGAWMMLRIVGAQGFTLLEGVILGLFTPTFAWIVIPFWTAVAGFALRLVGVDPVTLERVGPAAGAPSSRREGCSPSIRTALVVPVFNEVPEAVAARVAAMSRSLVATGCADRFHLHLLSDTSDPEIAAREQVEWLRLQAQHPGLAIHYRHRERNDGRKAGNIAEFCARCADDYDAMVVLDADSLMTGATLVELADLLEANPDVGLIQTVPLPALQRTLFGRLVQFAGCLYGPLLATGQAFWQGESANYWGHNAIVRLRPFAEHCPLPVLPGRPPLGGEIMSHDFVEAALLRRAGWKVVMVPRLGGSWEEVPGNVPDYATRDRRWAQGSLQHLRLLGMPGLHAPSRVHFALGAMGYVSSLLWLLILVAGTVYVLAPGLHGPTVSATLPAPPVAVSLLAVTAVILFLPKLLGVVDALVRARAGFAGAVALCASAGLEALFSVLLAPIMMLHHARFVAAICLGRSVRWTTPPRDRGRLRWGQAWRAAALPTAVGVVWGGATLALSPLFFVWMSPIFVGLLLAVPLLRWTSSAALGARAKDLGLLLVPSEATSIPEIEEVRAALEGVRDRRARPPRPRPAADPGRPYGVLLAPGDDVSGHSLTAGGRMYNAERGLFDLRQGRPLLVTGVRSAGAPASAAGDALLTAVEGLTSAELDRLRAMGSGTPRLVLTRHRVQSMGLSPNGDAATAALSPNGDGTTAQPSPNGSRATAGLSTNGDGPATGASPNGDRSVAVAAYAFPLDVGVGLDEVVELSCAAIPTGRATISEPEDVTGAELAGLALVRLGRLLPAVVSVPVEEPYGEFLRRALDEGAVLRVAGHEVNAFVGSAGAEVVPISEAPVPLAEATDSRFILFREGHGLQEHVAILVGNQAEWPDPVPVRLHSACLTGDLFGSLRCDCGEQLRGSMRVFAASGGGVLLYLAQEGRGIGLRNKFRAYTLQEGGLDTIDADNALGFGSDERRYDVAVQILQMIGVQRIELLTNNPDKVLAMKEAGITVVRRRPLHGTLNRHNLPYVRAKVQRAGHWLGDMLSQPLSGD